MDLSGLLPPKDLLDQVQGVEAGLRKRRRLGGMAWLGVVAATLVQLILEFKDKGLFTALTNLSEATGKGAVLWWPYLIPVVLLIFFILLGTWSRFWLKASKDPFRYSCSIGDFVPVHNANEKTTPVAEKMGWLSHDLARLLNERVRRFLFLDLEGENGIFKDDKGGKGDKEPKPVEKDSHDSHIHIHGEYVVRPSTDDEDILEIEIAPAIRLGPPGGAETLAHQPPPFPLSEVAGKIVIKRDEYNDLLEQVYYSVVTEVYRQLKLDVEQKIRLLPTRYFKALALLNEADDYARSNALHAYEEARDLYSHAAALIDPAWRQLPKSRFGKFYGRTQRKIFALGQRWRRFASAFRPPAAKIDVLCAKAEIGFARMLIFRRALAPILGQRMNPIFEARRRAHDACQRIERLGTDVPGRKSGLFNAYVTLGLSYYYLGDNARFESYLAKAQSEDPQKAVSDAVYLFAKGEVAGVGESKLGALRRAVEAQPRFEVAAFSLAAGLEEHWKSQNEFDVSLARMVLDEYKDLMRLNPGNLGAWANSGYIYWLLGTKADIEDAETCFTKGRQFKSINRETSIAELNYGLARIYAEQGNFVDAFRLYKAAVSEIFSQGFLQSSTDFRGYYFNPMGTATLGRFIKYSKTVRNKIKRLNTAEDAGLLTPEKIRATGSRKLRDSILAFVLNDVGEAYYSHYAITGEAGAGDDAVKLFEEAADLDQDYVLPSYNLALLRGGEDSLQILQQVYERQPMWPQGRLDLVNQYVKGARYLPNEAQTLLEEATQKEAERRKREAEKSKWEAEKRAQSEALKQQSPSAAIASGPKTELQLGKHLHRPAATQTPGPLLDERGQEALKNSIERLTQEIDRTLQEAKQKKDLAKQYLLTASDLARALVPHGWLWKDSDLKWSLLRDKEFEAGANWEKELNDLQVQALFAWAGYLIRQVEEEPLDGRRANADEEEIPSVKLTTRFASIARTVLVGSLDGFPNNTTPPARVVPKDLKQKRAQAIALLNHLQSHFWPVDFAIRKNLHELEQSKENLELLKDSLVQTLKTDSPYWALQEQLLEEYKFSFEEQRKAIRDALKSSPADRRLLELLGQLYESRADEFKDKARYYEDAVCDLPERSDFHYSLALSLLGSGGGTDEESLEKAVDALDEAVRLSPGNREYRQKLEQTKIKKKNLEQVLAAVGRFGRAASNSQSPRSRIQIEFADNLGSLVHCLPNSEEARLRDDTYNNLKWGLFYELGMFLPPADLIVSSDSETANFYTIYLDDIPWVAHELYLDRRFFALPPDDLKAAKINALPVTNPASGHPGSWVLKPDWKKAEEFAKAQNLFWWDPLEFPILQLANIFRMNAADFVDVDSIVGLFEYHKEQTLLDEMQQRGELDPLTKVLRALLAERFPISEFFNIVTTFRKHYGSQRSLIQIAERIRSDPAIRSNNPLLREVPTIFFRLGPEFERQIRKGLRDGGHVVLALEPNVCQELLTTLRDGVAEMEGHQGWPALMSSAKSRPWVRKLVELEFPNLQVIADSDVIPDYADRIAGTIEMDQPIKWEST